MIFPLLNEFLNQTSAKTRRANEPRIENFIQFIKSQNIKSIKDVKKMHIDTYANKNVNKLEMRAKTKKRYYRVVWQYFEFLHENGILENLIKIDKTIEFTDFISHKIIKRNAKLLPEIFDIVKVIHHAKDVNPRMYIYLCLMATNGARDGEIRTIKLENIIHQEAEIRTEHGREPIKFTYFTSGIEEAAQKKGQVIYFIHPKLENSLDWKIYLKQVKMYNEPVYLFQTTHTPRCIQYSNTRRNLLKYGEKTGLSELLWSTHIFRDIINESRMELQCDIALRSILINQSPVGTNSKHYLKKCRRIQNRYQYWLKYFPKKLEEIF